MRLLFFLFTLGCSSTSLLAQRQIVSQDIYLKKPFLEKYKAFTGLALNLNTNNLLDYSKSSKRGAHAFYNEKLKRTALFLLDANSANGFLYDGDFNLTDHQIFAREDAGVMRILGTCSRGKDYFLFLTDKHNRKFSVININFELDSIQEYDLDFDIGKEKYVQSFSKDSTFYLMTIGGYSSILWLYVFSNGTEYEVYRFDYSEQKFSDEYDDESIFLLLRSSNGQDNYKYTAEKIAENIPNNLGVTSQENKLYQFDNKLILTFDKAKKWTNTITIDLTSFVAEYKRYPQASVGCSSRYMKSNSFVHKNQIFQISACLKSLNLTMTDMETGKVIKAYSVGKDEEIDFKNSFLFKQVKGEKGKTKEQLITNTRYFLQLIQKQFVGIAAYENERSIEMQIGGFFERKRKVQYMTLGGGSSTVGSYYTVGASHTHFSTYYHSYSSIMAGYRRGITRTFYFKSLFEPITYNHQKGGAGDNVFDRIREDTENLNNNTMFVNVFKAGDLYIFGYYDALDEKYLMFGYKEFE